MIACIDGGLFCIGIPLLLTALFPWAARKVYRVCRKSCKCSCHSNKPVDDGDRPGFGMVDKDGKQSSGMYPYYKDK